MKVKEEQHATEYFHRAAKVFRAIGDTAEEGHTLTKIGDLYNAAGRQQQATAFHRQALSLLQQALPALHAGRDRKREAYALYYLSLIHQALGNAKEALDDCNRALPLFQSLRDSVMLDIVGIRIEELSQDIKEKK